MRLLLTLQYLGTRYAGWQSQTNAVAIQDVVEDAIAKMYGTAVRVEAAGRTDAGVHAAAQRIHFDAPLAIPPRGVVLGLNDLLPHDVRVIAADEVEATFHCRFAPHVKTYAYRIWNGPVLDVFRWETHAHVASALDVAAMQEAVRSLEGMHDFRSFTVLEPEVSSTTRKVTAASVTAEPAEGARAVIVRVSAEGFLRYMVRRIAGSLIEIGRGKLDAGAIARSLEPEFETARWTAPAKGLVLEEVRY